MVMEDTMGWEMGYVAGHEFVFVDGCMFYLTGHNDGHIDCPSFWVVPGTLNLED